jgi:hypothetical protein
MIGIGSDSNKDYSLPYNLTVKSALVAGEESIVHQPLG